jgi:hypothetical protein
MELAFSPVSEPVSGSRVGPKQIGLEKTRRVHFNQDHPTGSPQVVLMVGSELHARKS